MCWTFKEITKSLGFHLLFNLQRIIYTTLVTNINETNIGIYLYVPSFIEGTEAQAMFNESIKNVYTISIYSWYTDRKLVNDGLEFQVDIGSAQIIKSPKDPISAHQSSARIGNPNKAKNISNFDNVDRGKYFVEIDGQRYRKDDNITNYARDDCIDQNRELE